ncbi:hypothetical protein [Alteribacter natronophilus]|uniref:hypothetical protein n=1 Tax=Alteribacter natronophilus TaxID=2583810 RepID=UPI0014860481|nr:hypothetical protein [Alteribacter natronophilus]
MDHSGMHKNHDDGKRESHYMEHKRARRNKSRSQRRSAIYGLLGLIGGLWLLWFYFL